LRRRVRKTKTIDTLEANGSVNDRNRLLAGDFFFLMMFQHR
jgi:hypothetical protein